VPCSGGMPAWHGQAPSVSPPPVRKMPMARRAGHFVRQCYQNRRRYVPRRLRHPRCTWADVVSMLGAGCGDFHWFCSIPPADIYDMMLESVVRPVVPRACRCGAGNDNVGIAGEDIYPCKTEG
jgi:hypothetical protein